jgi:hypothetical protein
MPWFKTVVGIIVCIIILCLPLGFALRTDIELPTFVYGIAVTVGVFISFGLELFSLWILVLYCVIIIFTIVINYRENLIEAYEYVRGRPVKTQIGFQSLEDTGTAVPRAQKVSKYKGKLKILPSGRRDAGVKKKTSGVKWIFPTRPPLESEVHKVSLRASKPDRPMVGYAKKKTKGDRMPWVQYQGSKKQKRAIEKARQTAKRRGK